MRLCTRTGHSLQAHFDSGHGILCFLVLPVVTIGTMQILSSNVITSSPSHIQGIFPTDFHILHISLCCVQVFLLQLQSKHKLYSEESYRNCQVLWERWLSSPRASCGPLLPINGQGLRNCPYQQILPHTNSQKLSGKKYFYEGLHVVHPSCHSKFYDILS